MHNSIRNPVKMSSPQQNALLPNLSSNFDELQWIKEIRQTLEHEDLEDDTEIPVTIFSVPKTLMLDTEDSYIPHQVAIGPYHHLRPELYDMERYKVAAAKRNQKGVQNFKLQLLADKLMKFEHRIRSNYHRQLGFLGETLAWMMAVDATFLLEFLQASCFKEGKMLAKLPSRLMSHLIDSSGNKTSHNSILRDIVMLENQIPLFVLRFLFEFQFSSQDLADEMLLSMLLALSKELSPLKTVEACNNSDEIEIQDYAHILDFLYHFVVPQIEKFPYETIEILEDGEVYLDNKNPLEKLTHVKKIFHEGLTILSKAKQRPVVQRIKNVIFDKPLTIFSKFPIWKIVSKIPAMNMLRAPVERMFSTINKEKEKKQDEVDSVATFLENNIDKYHPMLQEITIPSVSDLFEVGVQFSPTNGGITSIKFDEKTLTFHIPVIKLDVNSEVVLRNLVAYEACNSSGPLVLTRYTELMNGIIDTDEDVKLLCEKGIIINHLKSEAEVANLWNGMSKSIRLTKVPSLDKVIGDVNKYYNGRLKVKFGIFMKKYVFRSWRILTFLSGILLLLLMSLQAFCQIYRCSNILHFNSINVPSVLNGSLLYQSELRH